MSGLTKISLKNGVAVVILCLLVLGFGFYSTTQIKQQTFPDIEFPAVFVQVVQPGSSTEEIETGVTTPIEDSLKGITGYDSITSTSTENAASIVIQFPFGADMDKMNGEVETAVGKVTLPAQAQTTIQRLSAGAVPIYQAAVFAGSAGADATALQHTLQNEVVPKLQKLAGVSKVDLTGEMSEHLNVVVDKDKAMQKGITLSAIKSALEGQNFALPLGSVTQDETTIPIRLSGQVSSLDQVKSLRLTGQTPEAGVTLLSDIATIETATTQDEITRFNGEPSLVIGVVKTQDANTADVSDAVKEVLADYEANGSVSLHVIQDQGEDIKESVSGLVREGLFGALFCVIIIFLFLRNVRATLISIVSLPISIFATIAVMNQMGFTLNIMTLGGIAVSIGRIVDDSIVVIENIYRWKQERGKELGNKELAYKATKEVIGAVASSTVAMVVVFLPLAFVSGIIGEFFRPFSVAVVVSILTSLLVAMMLIPVLGSKFFKKVKEHKEGGRLTRGFEKFIRGALKRKAIVIVVSLLLLVGSLGLIPSIGVAFLPAGSEPTASVTLTLPAKSSVETTNEVAGKVESYFKSLDGVERYDATVGGTADIFSNGGPNKATLTVQFKKGTDMDPMLEKLEAELPNLVSGAAAGTTVEVQGGEQQGAPTGDTIEMKIYGQNPDDLANAAQQIENLMRSRDDLKKVTNNMNEVTPKWVLTLNRQGIDAGVSPYAIMQLVGEQLRPVAAGSYAIDRKVQEITLSYGEQIGSKEELENVLIPTAAGVKKLGEVANIEEQNAWIKVNHDDGRMYAEVIGTVKDAGEVSKVTQEVKNDVDSLTLPSGVELETGGGMEMIMEGFISLGIAMAIAVGLVFLTMSMTFGGLVTPLIILCSLLFIPVGSLTALLITGQALTMSSMIGMLMLVGIVVTNAVVLLDRVEKNRKSGMQITEAIVEASTTRLRPILMTAFATMLALVPLALSGSTTSLISGGLAVTVIGGLFTSTLLTLVFVPVVYELAWRKRKVKPEETLD